MIKTPKTASGAQAQMVGLSHYALSTSKEDHMLWIGGNQGFKSCEGNVPLTFIPATCAVLGRGERSTLPLPVIALGSMCEGREEWIRKQICCAGGEMHRWQLQRLRHQLPWHWHTEWCMSPLL